MKKYLFFPLLLFSIFQLSAQEIERQVVSSGGTDMESGDLSLVSTVGEVAIKTLDATTADLVLAEGFHQGALTIVSTYDFDSGITFDVFPNPSTEVIYITSDATEILTLEIVDLLGRKISSQELSIPIQKAAINVAHLAAAQYFLQISNVSGNLVHTFTIQKISK